MRDGPGLVDYPRASFLLAVYSSSLFFLSVHSFFAFLARALLLLQLAVYFALCAGSSLSPRSRSSAAPLLPTRSAHGWRLEARPVWLSGSARLSGRGLLFFPSPIDPKANSGMHLLVAFLLFALPGLLFAAKLPYSYYLYYFFMIGCIISNSFIGL